MNFQLPLSTLFISFFVVLGLEPRALNILDKCHPTESQPKTPRVFYMKVLGQFYMLADTKHSILFNTDSQRRYERGRTLNSVLPEITIPWLVIKHSINCCCRDSNPSCTFSVHKRKKGKREQVNQATVSTNRPFTHLLNHVAFRTFTLQNSFYSALRLLPICMIY